MRVRDATASSHTRMAMARTGKREMSHFDVSQDSWLTCSHLLCPSVALLDVSIIHLAHLPLAPFSALTPRVAREKRHLAPWLTWA